MLSLGRQSDASLCLYTAFHPINVKESFGDFKDDGSFKFLNKGHQVIEISRSLTN